MKKTSLFSLWVLFFASSSLFAGQGGTGGNDYMWTDESINPKITYDWIDIKDGDALFGGGALDDQIAGPVPLTIDFNFFGSKKTQVWVGVNGFITFSDPGSPAGGYGANAAIPTASGPDSMLAVYWDDNTGGAANNPNVYTKVIGSSPFRKFIIQWYLADADDVLEFQIILNETSNTIKYQYGRLDLASGTPGSSATIGLQASSTDGLQYSYNSQIFANISAILFHGEGVDGVDGAISPTSVTVNSSQEFTYLFDNISPSSSDVLGKIDSVSITIPAAFSSTPTVTSIKINDGSAFIQNSASKPEDRGFATWRVSGGDIIVQTADFEVIDSLIVKFIEQAPASTSSGNSFISEYGAELDVISGSQSSVEDALGWDVEVTAAAGSVD